METLKHERGVTMKHLKKLQDFSFVRDIYWGHLRYSTTGKRALSFVHSSVCKSRISKTFYKKIV